MACEEEQIKELNYRFTAENQCIITWFWPKGIDAVYIYKSLDDEVPDIDNLTEKDMELYTQDEYKEYKGYSDIISRGTHCTYFIYPYIREKDDMILINQNNMDNKITIASKKLCIYYSIKERHKWFSNSKSVQIIIESEKVIPKDAICYVAKAGSFPKNKEDGSIYFFNDDINPPRKVFGEIRFNKDFYIRLFLNDGKKYGEIYSLIRK